MPKSPEERQAAALEDLSHSLKDLVRIHKTSNRNIMALSELLKNSQTLDNEPLGLIEEKTRIPVFTFPHEPDKRPIGLAELDSDNILEIKLRGADLVGDIEYLTELSQLKGVYIAVELYPVTATNNERDDANAAAE